MSPTGADDYPSGADKYLRDSRKLRAAARRRRRRARKGRGRSPRSETGWELVRRSLVLALELGVVVVAGVLAMGIWILVHALDASGRLDAAHTDVARLRADLLAGRPAGADMLAAQHDADAARRDTHDWVWSAVSWLPPVQTVQGITTAIDTLATQALPDFIAVAPSLRPAVLRVRHDTIALAPLVAAAPTMRRAAAAASLARSQVANLPGGWFGVISSAREKVLTQLASLAGTVDDISRVATAGPTMLGEHGLRRYFVGIQNNAEARGTGGLVAAYAIVTANHGTIRVVEHGNDVKLQSFVAPRPVVALGKDYQAVYGNYHPAQDWTVSNLSPNFPDAALIWSHMWEAQSGEHVDGAFGVDPVGLGELLGAVGTVKLPNYQGVFDGPNLATFIESTQYSAFPGLNNPLRKNFLAEVGTAVIKKMLSGSGDAQLITETLGHMAGAGHLELWSTRSSEQQQIRGTPLAGELSAAPSPYAAVTVDNAFASKLDYYLHRRLDYRAGGCSASTRSSTITITLTNAAPRHGLPAYVRLRAVPGTRPVVEQVPTNKLLVFVHATAGAVLNRATLDGKVVGVGSGLEHGHPVYLVQVVLQPGVPRTIRLELTEPTTRGAATTQVQPLAQPQQTVLDVPRCG